MYHKNKLRRQDRLPCFKVIKKIGWTGDPSIK